MIDLWRLEPRQYGVIYQQGTNMRILQDFNPQKSGLNMTSPPVLAGDAANGILRNLNSQGYAKSVRPQDHVTWKNSRRRWRQTNGWVSDWLIDFVQRFTAGSFDLLIDWLLHGMLRDIKTFTVNAGNDLKVLISSF